MDVAIRVSGQAVAKGRLPKPASIGFRTDALHVGQDRYSPEKGTRDSDLALAWQLAGAALREVF